MNHALGDNQNGHAQGEPGQAYNAANVLMILFVPKLSHASQEPATPPRLLQLLALSAAAGAKLKPH